MCAPPPPKPSGAAARLRQRRGMLAAAAAAVVVPPAAVVAAPNDILKDAAEGKASLEEVEELAAEELLLIGIAGAAAVQIAGEIRKDEARGGDDPVQYRGVTSMAAKRPVKARAHVDISPPPMSAVDSVLFGATVNPKAPVADVMQRSVRVIRQSAPCRDAEPLMDGITGLVVLADASGDTADPNKVVGVFSKRDLFCCDPDGMVGDFMTSPALTINPSVSVMDCAAVMLKHEVHRLPVVDPDSGRLVGIVTRTDVFNALLSKYGPNAKPPSEEECKAPTGMMG